MPLDSRSHGTRGDLRYRHVMSLAQQLGFRGKAIKGMAVTVLFRCAVIFRQIS